MGKREILKTIAEQAGKGKLKFSANAEIALRISKALDDPACHIDVAARLVQAEPLLAARVVAISNSVVFNRSGREITDVHTAVARLGFRTVRALATALVTRQMAGTPSLQEHQAVVAQLWEHTAHVAALAHVIAHRVTRLDPEAAMFAGIIHEVGGFYLLSRAKDFPALLDGEMTEWVEEGESEIGRAVLKALAVPSTAVDAIEALWQGYLAMPPASLGDTLLLADWLAPVESPLHQQKIDDSEGRHASIDMLIGQETLVDILRESAEEVESLSNALRF
ncbi:MAG: HDOD domain-containing protein [Sterolibacterium sp.]|nr:HDOD domain-containing protein [Sterolibacterium sp.]